MAHVVLPMVELSVTPMPQHTPVHAVPNTAGVETVTRTAVMDVNPVLVTQPRRPLLLLP